MWVGVGWEEEQDQPIRRGEGWLCSEPRSRKLMDPARQVPAHVRLNKGPSGFLGKCSPHSSH